MDDNVLQLDVKCHPTMSRPEAELSLQLIEMPCQLLIAQWASLPTLCLWCLVCKTVHFVVLLQQATAVESVHTKFCI